MKKQVYQNNNITVNISDTKTNKFGNNCAVYINERRTHCVIYDNESIEEATENVLGMTNIRDKNIAAEVAKAILENM